MDSQFPIALHILGFLTARDGQPLSSQVLARSYGTNPVVLRRVLAKLQRAGLVQTRRGVGGGSTLARPPDRITLREAYEAVAGEAPILTRHPEGCAGAVAPVLAAYVNGLMAQAELTMLTRLQDVTVAEMDREVRARICAARPG